MIESLLLGLGSGLLDFGGEAGGDAIYNLLMKGLGLSPETLGQKAGDASIAAAEGAMAKLMPLAMYNRAGMYGPRASESAAQALGGGFRAGTGEGRSLFSRMQSIAESMPSNVARQADLTRTMAQREFGNLRNMIGGTVGPASLRSQQLSNLGRQIASTATNVTGATMGNLTNALASSADIYNKANALRMGDIEQRFQTEVEPYLTKLNEGAVSAGIGPAASAAGSTYQSTSFLKPKTNPLEGLASILGMEAGERQGVRHFSKLLGNIYGNNQQAPPGSFDDWLNTMSPSWGIVNPNDSMSNTPNYIDYMYKLLMGR